MTLAKCKIIGLKLHTLQSQQVLTDDGECVLGNHGMQEASYESVKTPLGGPSTIAAIAMFTVLFWCLSTFYREIFSTPMEHFHSCCQA
jgi:hypothetical protein